MFLVTWALNWTYDGRRDHWTEGTGLEHENVGRRPTLAQQSALNKIGEHVEDFLKGPTVPAKDWQAEIRKTKLDYNGGEVKVPVPVTWAQLEPALPPPGSAGRVRAIDLAEGWLAEVLADPRAALLPEAEWPDPPPPAKVWVDTQEEWVKICRGSARLGIFTFLRKSEIFHVRGEPVLNGLTGVEKPGKTVPNTDLAVLRMIINAIPTNMFQQLLIGIRTLPYFGQWSGVQLDDQDRVLVFSEKDMTAAFYIYLMEEGWWPFQALSRPVKGADVREWRPDIGEDEEAYAAVTVMMMGWKSACGCLQHFHRRLCFEPAPVGAGLAAANEVRRDMPMPRSNKGALTDGPVSFFLRVPGWVYSG